MTDSRRRLKVDFFESRLESGAASLRSTASDYAFETFEPSKAPELLAETETYRARILAEDTDTKKIANYEKSRLDFDAQLAVSLIRREGEIVGFTTLFSSPRYPARSARALNRYYLDWRIRRDDIRSGGISLSINLVHHHLSVARGMGLEGVFISTEAYRARWIESWAAHASEHTGARWKSVADVFLICENRQSMGCWQHLAWCAVSPAAVWEPPFERLTHSEALAITGSPK